MVCRARLRRINEILATSVALAAVAIACGKADLRVGDDTTTSSPEPDAEPSLDSNVPDSAGVDSATEDAAKTEDAATPEAASPCTFPAMCLAAGEPCTQFASNSTCSAGKVCCAVTCPEIAPPSPTLCDGGPTAPLFDSSGCTIGFGCAPVACASAGGQCVALGPGACANGTPGNANKYSCPGAGTMCCLP
jgi:hypothetical protein